MNTGNQVNVVVAGGGIIGLFCAYYLAKSGFKVILLEKNDALGQETSTHNSGVIHGGIYYPPGSLKGELCIKGNPLLKRLLEKWKAPFIVRGKLIIATEKKEIPQLEKLFLNGQRWGIPGIDLLDKKEAEKREPNIRVEKAIYSPGTGVFDQGRLLKILEIKVLAENVDIVTGAEVCGIQRTPDSLVIDTKRKGSVSTDFLVNSAGLYSDELARICGEKGHRIYPCRGEYLTVVPKKESLVNGLVYPVPTPNSLGLHFTKTVDGELWVGPTARYVQKKSDYETDRITIEMLIGNARKICPGIDVDDLRLGQSGIRPKRYNHGEPPKDFHINFQAKEPRIIHLIGIESPGLTASPAIGKKIDEMVKSVCSG